MSVEPVELAVRLPEGARTGVPLVLLPAFPLNSQMWEEVVPGLAGVAQVVLVDLPGLGDSPLPGGGPPSLDVSAAGVVAVLDRLGLPGAILAGVSMGGYVAMAVARHSPERVTGLALIDTRVEADGEQARANRLRVADDVLGEAGTRALAPMLDGLLGSTSRASRPGVVGAVRDRLRTAPPAGVAWSQRAMATRPDSSGVLAGLRVPVAVVVGEEDQLTPPSAAEAMAAMAPDAVLTVIPAAGHLTPLEAPRAVAHALTCLVVRIRPGGGGHQPG